MGPGGKEKHNLEMAEALEGMERALSSENSEFLEKILGILNKEKPLSAKQETKLEALYEKYFGEDADKNDDEEDIDEDDFV